MTDDQIKRMRDLAARIHELDEGDGTAQAIGKELADVVLEVIGELKEEYSAEGFEWPIKG